MTVEQLFKYYRTDSPTAVAFSIGYSSANVYAWKKSGKIPYRAQQLIEAMTGGKLKADREGGR